MGVVSHYSSEVVVHQKLREHVQLNEGSEKTLVVAGGGGGVVGAQGGVALWRGAE